MRRRRHRHRRYSRERTVLSLIFRVLLLCVLGLGLFLFYLGHLFYARGPLVEDRLVLIESGLGISEISDHLYSEGVISDPIIFMLGSSLSHGGRLQSGEYFFKSGISMYESSSLLSSGRVYLRKLTIPEGWTVWQVRRELESNSYLKGSLPADIEEGSLRPDTYFYRYGESRLDILENMRESQSRLLEELWSSRSENLPFSSLEEAVILASIVERETGISGERGKIAGVFINRLRRGMRLQADPTIIYGITDGRGVLGRPLTKADIAGKTLYNTYRIDGLPPGAISNPGRASLEAVLHPEETDALYFVADGKGGHVFSKTLESHNRHVRALRALERKRKQETGEGSDGQ